MCACLSVCACRERMLYCQWTENFRPGLPMRVLSLSMYMFVPVQINGNHDDNDEQEVEKSPIQTHTQSKREVGTVEGIWWTIENYEAKYPDMHVLYIYLYDISTITTSLYSMLICPNKMRTTVIDRAAVLLCDGLYVRFFLFLSKEDGWSGAATTKTTKMAELIRIAFTFQNRNTRLDFYLVLYPTHWLILSFVAAAVAAAAVVDFLGAEYSI